MRVFVSHASTDHAIAVAIVEALEARGIKTWFAPKDITGGADFATAIPRAIYGSRLMVILLSERAMHSFDVQSEVNLARSEGLALLPVRLPDCPDPLSDDAWRYRLSGSQLCLYARADVVAFLAQNQLAELIPVAHGRGQPAAPSYDVVLTDAGDKKIAVIKEIRAMTALGLKEAKDLVEADLPQVVLSRVSKEQAVAASTAFRSVGAETLLEPVTVFHALERSAACAFDVVLTDAGDKKIAVIKEIRAMTSLGLKEAKDLVEGVPQVVLTQVSKEQATAALDALRVTGAEVIMRAVPAFPGPECPTVAYFEARAWDRGWDAHLGGEPPAGFYIKANERSMKYHVPGTGGYERTIVDRWFASEHAAKEAGFTKAAR